MPRKKKNEEFQNWLKNENLFVYRIENESIKTYYMSNILSDELVAENVKSKYKECFVTYIGRISEIHLQELSTNA